MWWHTPLVSALRRRGRLISGFKVTLVYKRVPGQPGLWTESLSQKTNKGEKEEQGWGERERRKEGRKDRRTDGQTNGLTGISTTQYIAQHIQSPSSIPYTTRKKVLICNSKLHSRATMVSELLCVTLFIKLTKLKNTQWAAMLN